MLILQIHSHPKQNLGERWMEAGDSQVWCCHLPLPTLPSALPLLHGVALRFPEPWLSHIAPHIHVHEEEASAPGESYRPIATAALAHAPWDTLLDTHTGRISEHVLSKSPFYSKQSCPAAAAFFLSFFLFLSF